MDIKSEWQRVRRLMTRLNRKYKSSFTMDYVFGAPTVDRLGNLYKIRNVSDLEHYLQAHRISAPKTPKIDGIEFSNLIKRFQRAPVGFNQAFVEYLQQLRQFVDEPILMQYVRNIYSMMDLSYKYDDNGYLTNIITAVKSLNQDIMNYYANQEDFDRAEEVRQLYNRNLLEWETQMYDYTGEK